MKNVMNILICVFILILPVIFFRSYFFNNKVPFPSNLLVSFYEPWKSYKWESYSSGPSNKPIGFDNLRVFYPLRKFTNDQIKSFKIPLWNPYSFSGNTHLATYQSAVFHPLSFLFFIFPQIDAWSIIIILSPLFATLFMYLFLREIEVGYGGSIFGAIVFAFSSFMIVWWEESFMTTYSALFLPLVLYSIARLSEKISIKDYLILCLSLAFSIFSGWFQMTFYIFLFSIAWSIYVFIKNKVSKKNIALICFGFLISVLISSIHLLPSLEAYLYSARGTTDAKFLFDNYLVSPFHLITFLIPDFFGSPGAYNYFAKGFYYEKALSIGVVGIVFCLFELFKKNSFKYSNFFKVSFIIFLSLGFSILTSWFLLYYLKLIFISTVIPSRVFFLSTFCGSVLSAFSMANLLKGRIEKKTIFALILFLSLIFISLWIFIVIKITIMSHIKHVDVYSLGQLRNMNVSFRNLILPTLIFIVLSISLFIVFIKEEFRKYILLISVSLSLIGSLYLANKYLYFSERKFVFPTVPVIEKLKHISGNERVWSIGSGYIDRNFFTQYQIQSPEGYDSFYISRYGELLFAANNDGKFSKQIPRADAALPFSDKISEILKDSYREKLLKTLSVRYVASKNKKEYNSDHNFESIWSDGIYSIYKYKNALPRAFLVGDYRIGKSESELISYFYDTKIDLSKTVVLEQNPLNFQRVKNFKGTARINSYTPEKVIIDTQSRSGSVLFLSDNYFPGWNAYVDGRKTKIYRSNYTFRSVVVPKGNHVIIFKYEPLSFKIGSIMTLIGAFLLALSVGIIKNEIKKIK